jgi:hypothetical protein
MAAVGNSYSKEEIKKLIGDMGTISIEVVETLPTENIQENKIYFVPVTGESEAYYNEYVYIGGTWELVGSSQFDLSDWYATDTTINTLIDHGTISATELGTIINIEQLQRIIKNYGGRATVHTSVPISYGNWYVYGTDFGQRLKVGVNFIPHNVRMIIDGIENYCLDATIHVLKTFEEANIGDIIAWWYKKGTGTQNTIERTYIKKVSNDATTGTSYGIDYINEAIDRNFLATDMSSATITGNWTFNNNIISSKAPTATNHLTNKAYVDGILTNVDERLESLPTEMVNGFEYVVEDTEIPINYTVSNRSGTFSLGSDGYYKSTNKSDSSYSVCRVTFNNDREMEFDIDYIAYSENNYDYGIFSKVDCALALSSSDDGATGSSLVMLNTKGDTGSSAVRQVHYVIPAGSHYIDVKYRKDSSQSSGNDDIRFKIPASVGSRVVEEAHMATQEYVAEQLENTVTIFDGDEDEYVALSPEARNGYMFAFVNPLARLVEEEFNLLEEILLDSESMPTAMDLTDEEIDAELDIIINGMASVEEEMIVRGCSL